MAINDDDLNAFESALSEIDLPAVGSLSELLRQQEVRAALAFGDVMPIIAAVEAWYEDRWDGYAESPPEIMQRLDQAEAAIARVRELADRVAHYHGDGLPRIKPRDIYRALDGER